MIKEIQTTHNVIALGSNKKMKVLIAEDILSNFELLNCILSNDFELFHAWDGKEAVEMFKQHAPHIVLMDIKMPKLNGYEAIKEIRKMSKIVPVIAVTAYAFPNDQEEIKKSGFDAYSPKPLNAILLRKQIADLLYSNASAS
jgi:CheY-like chemotaxis protein